MPSENVNYFVNDPVFHKASLTQHKKNRSRRFIAAEIEVSEVDEGNDVSRVVRKWQGSVVEDGSLPEDGFEINTAPASGDLYVEQVTAICDALSSGRASVNSDCGLHVHVDARDIDHCGLHRLIKLYARLEPLLFQMVSQRRAGNSYCKPCGEQYLMHLEAKSLTYKATRENTAKAAYGTANTRGNSESKYHNSRYNALNIHSWYYRKTIECRLMSGTANADKIIPWGMMWARLVDMAASTTDKEMDTLLTTNSRVQILFNNMHSPTIVNFIRKRLTKYGAQSTLNEMSGRTQSSFALACELEQEVAKSKERASRRQEAEVEWVRRELRRQQDQREESDIREMAARARLARSARLAAMTTTALSHEAQVALASWPEHGFYNPRNASLEDGIDGRVLVEVVEVGGTQAVLDFIDDHLHYCAAHRTCLLNTCEEMRRIMTRVTPVTVDPPLDVPYTSNMPF